MAAPDACDVFAWDHWARRLLLGGPLRTVVTLSALVEDGAPDDYVRQRWLSTGTGTLDRDVRVTGSEMAVVQLPFEHTPDITNWRCSQCVRTHGFTIDDGSREGRIDHPFRIFLVLWLFRRQRQFRRMVEPSWDDYTLSEVAEAAGRAQIRIPPVSMHYTQLVVFMASLLRYDHSATHLLLGTVEHACFDCQESTMFFPAQRHWTHHIASVFSVLVRGAPCAVLRWCFPDNLNDRSFEGASFNFVALARLRHAMSQYDIGEDWPRWSCSFSLRPMAGLNFDAPDGGEAALRAVRGAFAVLSLISCYSMGCAGNEDVDSPVPGIDLGSVVGEQTLGDELVEVAGTLAALLRHEFFMARLSLEALVSAIRISPMSARRFPENPISFMSSTIASRCPEDMLARAAPVHAPLSVMVCLAAGTRPDDESACWIDPLDAFTGGMTHGAAANSIVPALRADGGGGGGRIDLTGLPFYPDSVNLASLFDPLRSLRWELTIAPPIFSRLTRAPLFRRCGTRSAWAIDGYHRGVLRTLLASLGRVCADVGGCSLPRPVVVAVLYALNIRDVGGRMTQEHYVCGLLREANALWRSRSALRTASLNIVYTYHPT